MKKFQTYQENENFDTKNAVITQKNAESMRELRRL